MKILYSNEHTENAPGARVAQLLAERVGDTVARLQFSGDRPSRLFSENNGSRGEVAPSGVRELVAGKLEALRRGQVDILLLASEYSPSAQQTCGECGAGITLTRHSTCPECGSGQLRPANLREELIRLAEQNGAEIEIVHQSDFLMELGGIGCLLRYRL